MLTRKDHLIKSLIDEGFLKTPRLIKAFRRIDRADFVLAEYRHEAYGNYPLPIGENQTISQPLTVAFMLELLDPRAGEKILDIGSGSGWTTALLAHCVSQKSGNQESGIKNHGRIFAIERIGTLCEFGKENMIKYNFVKEGVVKTFCRDATEGLPEYAPYDKILAGAAASAAIPHAWRKQLRIGGKIVAPVDGSIWLFVKKSETKWDEKEFPGFAFVPLVRDAGLRMKNRESRIKETKERKQGLIPASFPVVFGCTLALTTLLFLSEVYRPHASSQGVKTIEIAPGMGSRAIGGVLKTEGVIRSKWTFITYVSLRGHASSLKPGAYEFTNQTIPDIARLLVAGGGDEKNIIIPEGWSGREIAEFLGRENTPAGTDFKDRIMAEAAADRISRFPILTDKPKDAGLEGYLFPDTYRISKRTSADELVEKMLQNFERKLAPAMREESRRQNRSIFELVTMASLIEKEVVSQQDRELVSGILWKRLELEIPLQVDATVVYIKRERGERVVPPGRVSTQDTKIRSPYNTYLNRGLPRGPIANPGLSALQAALNPQSSPYLYYLSAADGKTIFSRTLEEHNRAKAKYLQ